MEEVFLLLIDHPHLLTTSVDTALTIYQVYKFSRKYIYIMDLYICINSIYVVITGCKYLDFCQAAGHALVLISGEMAYTLLLQCLFIFCVIMAKTNSGIFVIYQTNIICMLV